MFFTPAAGFDNGADLTVDVDDLGNTGDDGAKTDSEKVRIGVGPNDAPVNAVPGTQMTHEDTAKVLSGVDAISVSDVDAAGASVQVTFTSILNGDLDRHGHARGTAGLTFTSGDGTDDTVMTF